MITPDELRGLAPFPFPKGIRRIHLADGVTKKEKSRLKARLRMKRLRQSNPEKYRAKNSAWAKKNRDKTKANRLRWVANNPERAKQIAREASKRWRQNMSPEMQAKRKKRERQYFLDNRDKINARRREIAAQRKGKS